MCGAKRQSLSVLLFDWTNVLRSGQKIAFLSAAIIVMARAEIIDRVAVSVGSSVITTSDLDTEIRVTAALNGVEPDFSSTNRRATANRLVEQKLIRRELELSKYMLPDASAAEPLFEQFRKTHAEPLATYGVTEQQVRNALLWQLTLLRFIEVRFRPGVQVSDQDISEYFDKVVKPAAQAAHPDRPVSLEDYRDQIEEMLTGQRTDQEVDNWLKDARKRTEIMFHEEVFE
jgi:hypothetical protein